MRLILDVLELESFCFVFLIFMFLSSPHKDYLVLEVISQGYTVDTHVFASPCIYPNLHTLSHALGEDITRCMVILGISILTVLNPDSLAISHLPFHPRCSLF